MRIEKWLRKFENNWEKGDVEGVMALFTDGVEYHETPTEMLDTGELREEWGSVREQEEIELDTEVFSRDGEKFTVQWSLEYTQDGERNFLNGIYLIKLSPDGKCYEFWQYCQTE